MSLASLYSSITSPSTTLGVNVGSTVSEDFFEQLSDGFGNLFVSSVNLFDPVDHRCPSADGLPHVLRLREAPADFPATHAAHLGVDGLLNFVTAFRFFLNAEQQLRQEALEAIRKHLKKDGRLVCNIQMNATSPCGVASRIANEIPFSRKRNTMSSAELSALLKSTGFTVERVTAYGYLPRPGRLLPSLCEASIEAAERVARAMGIPSRFAQQLLSRDGHSAAWDRHRQAQQVFMIIELFGPAAAGKTTFAHALRKAQR